MYICIFLQFEDHLHIAFLYNTFCHQLLVINIHAYIPQNKM